MSAKWILLSLSYAHSVYMCECVRVPVCMHVQACMSVCVCVCEKTRRQKEDNGPEERRGNCVRGLRHLLLKSSSFS